MKRKTPIIEASGSRRRQDEEHDSLGEVYDDTTRLLEKGGESLKWGEVFQMFKRQTFPVEADDQDELQIFNNIWRLQLHRVETHVAVLSYENAIVWILKHVDLENRYILNARGEPITSF